LEIPDQVRDDSVGVGGDRFEIAIEIEVEVAIGLRDPGSPPRSGQYDSDCFCWLL